MRAIRALRAMEPNLEVPVFRARHNGNTRMEKATMRQRLRRLLGAAGMPHPDYFSLHSLRRGGATVALQHGKDLRYIMTQGRWASDCVGLYLYAMPEQ